MGTWIALTLAMFALFAALLWLGLERQRRELSALAAAAEEWTLADIALKRSQMQLRLREDFDPAAWAASVVQAAWPQADLGEYRVALADEGMGIWVEGQRAGYLLTPLAPKDLRRLVRPRGGRLSTPAVVDERLRALARRPTVRPVTLAQDALLDLAYAAALEALGHKGGPRPRRVYVYRVEAG